ncbi:MAG: cyclophilin-like fold protein [Aminobacterium sp.]|jgi:hypothetical protein|uniref:cyclophilin-like fold protein n=1 Tax=unclassified Aminobacterium TaxID=2685012 RepID=UPI001BCF8A75|nr:MULTISPECIES: cyclophilin-like fold protein [unclassified Aminobacterium]MDD2206408.1 cyclophilin-like fold protein [Aminobacterium sp.]MDD3425394.1 cyclophilin-like fold protein [Aminobacterium sp.]MDD3707753.1 cyclophilin-like fold protein [Aminobacterium sp.]MDD4228257.1 cyclophilin-like fold protein [Aminobacterium sp.]MDD4551294.1 cyclophilin-like fold protein [Aminobacterium sp.]
MDIRIRSGEIEIDATLNNTKTASRISKILPIKSRANTWGEEIYFTIPLIADLEDGKEVVEAGDLAFWPTGSAFCIFLGPTPASQGDEIRPASAVTVIGKVKGDIQELKKVKNGDPIFIERA